MCTGKQEWPGSATQASSEGPGGSPGGKKLIALDFEASRWDSALVTSAPLATFAQLAPGMQREGHQT